MPQCKFNFEEVFLLGGFWGSVSGDVRYTVDNRCVTVDSIECRDFRFVWSDCNGENEVPANIDDDTKTAIAELIAARIDASELGLSATYNHCGYIAVDVMPNCLIENP